jgi:hypothetical protein
MITYEFNYKKTKIHENHLNAENKCWFFVDDGTPRWVFKNYKHVMISKYYAPFYAMIYDFSLLTDCELSEKIVQSLMIAGPNKKFTTEEVISIVTSFSPKPIFKHDIVREIWILDGINVVVESGLISLNSQTVDELSHQIPLN